MPCTHKQIHIVCTHKQIHLHVHTNKYLYYVHTSKYLYYVYRNKDIYIHTQAGQNGQHASYRWAYTIHIIQSGGSCSSIDTYTRLQIRQMVDLPTRVHICGEGVTIKTQVLRNSHFKTVTLTLVALIKQELHRYYEKGNTVNILTRASL